jgi:hypothetical protein
MRSVSKRWARRAFVALTGTALAVTAAVAGAIPASAIDTSFRYEINPQHNVGMCLDVAGAAVPNHTPVVQFQCTRSANQQFLFTRVSGNVYEIRPLHSWFLNKCLDVTGPSTANGATLQLFSCNGQNNQRFRLLDDNGPTGVGGTSRIASVFSDKCLEVAGASNAGGAAVVQNTCNGQAHQRFDLSALAD